MISIVVSVVKVPVSPEECSTLGAAPLKGIFDAPGWPISRVLSTPPKRGWATISLGVPLPARSCSLPGTCPPKRKKTNRLPFPEGNLVPAWPCSRWGLPGRRIAACAGGLLHRRFTLAPALERVGAVCFCGPIHYLAAIRGLPGIVSCGARTFLDTRERRRGRPASLGRFHHNRIGQPRQSPFR